MARRKLSILYLRCEAPRFSDEVSKAQKSFNSLFEMPNLYLAHRRTVVIRRFQFSI